MHYSQVNVVSVKEKHLNKINSCDNQSLSSPMLCTCPSGDGSLRWPCPEHPPDEKLEEAARKSGHISFESMKQCADAWEAVVDTISKHVPEWWREAGTGKESAVAIINRLAQQPAAEAQPVAWDVFGRDGTLIAGRVSKENAEEIASRWEYKGSYISPLYAHPPPSAAVESPLMVTRGDGVPLPDQATAVAEFKRQCLSPISHEDWF